MSLQITTQTLRARAESANALGSSIKFVFEDQTVIVLDGRGDANEVHNDDHDAECTVKIAKDDLDALLAGTLNPMMAFMSGKLRVEGDMGVAMKLSNFMG